MESRAQVSASNSLPGTSRFRKWAHKVQYPLIILDILIRKPRWVSRVRVPNSIAPNKVNRILYDLSKFSAIYSYPFCFLLLAMNSYRFMGLPGHRCLLDLYDFSSIIFDFYVVDIFFHKLFIHFVDLSDVAGYVHDLRYMEFDLNSNWSRGWYTHPLRGLPLQPTHPRRVAKRSMT